MAGARASVSGECRAAQHAVVGGGIFRPFERGNETWAELVVCCSRAIVDIATRHQGRTVVIVGHSETVEISFHALGLLPLYRSFDLRVAPASVTEWQTDQSAPWLDQRVPARSARPAQPPGHYPQQPSCPRLQRPYRSTVILSRPEQPLQPAGSPPHTRSFGHPDAPVSVRAIWDMVAFRPH
jgi:hypothetical protein